MGKSFLARDVAGRSAAQSTPVQVSRADLAGAFLLGQLRPGQHEILGPSSRATTGRWTDRATVRRCRTDLRRFLARKSSVPTSRLLLVHVSEAGRNRAAGDRAGGGRLESGPGRVRAVVRRRPQECVA